MPENDRERTSRKHEGAQLRGFHQVLRPVEAQAINRTQGFPFDDYLPKLHDVPRCSFRDRERHWHLAASSTQAHSRELAARVARVDK